MIATYVLYLREGLEASLIVSILLAAARQMGQPRMARAIWTGVVLAGVGALVGGIAIYATVRSYAGTTFQTAFETCTYLAAVGLLTTMTFWMQKHSRTLKKELVAKAGTAGSGFALGVLAFSTVGREGLESAVFTLAFAFDTSGWLLILGGVLGALSAVGLCILVYRLGYRLDYRVFFRVMGVILLFFAAGLLGDAIQNAQALGWINIGTTHLWDTSRLLSENTTVGDLLHSMVGYAETPSLLQAALYVLYLAIAGTFFVRATRKPPLPTSTAVRAPMQSA